MMYRYDFLADRRNVVSSVYLSRTIRRFRSKQTFDRLNTKRCTHAFKRTGICSKKRCENTKRSMQRLFEYLDVSTFSISMASCLLENSWNALGLFGGRSPLFTFLVFSISTSLIFSRPNAKGRWPPSFSLPEIVAHVSQKRLRTMDFISIAVRDLLRLVLAENFSTRIPCIFLPNLHISMRRLLTR